MSEKTPLNLDNPRTPEEQKIILLEKINKALSALGSSAKWKRAPEDLEEYLPLKGKILVMVDDAKDLLKHFIPDLMVATDGNASFVEYTGQETDMLIEQIMRSNPYIVLMDYHLSADFKGSSVIRALNARNFSGKTVGFSSDDNSKTSNEFMSAGAKGTVNKNTSRPEKSVIELAKLISKE
jgi:CheY-like chemotaxis protein